MKDTHCTCVSFDPGFANYNPGLNESNLEQINHISKLKSHNQRKFQVIKLETSFLKPLTTITYIYYGCVAYGSVLASKYNNPPATIEGNHILELPDHEKDNADLTLEVKIIQELYKKLNKDIQFYLKRKSKLPARLEEFSNLYKEFVELNNHFKDLKTTSQIKLPAAMEHFRQYTPEKLDIYEKKLFEITQTGNLEEVLNIS